jgi:hypothetical protein
LNKLSEDLQIEFDYGGIEFYEPEEEKIIKTEEVELEEQFPK